MNTCLFVGEKGEDYPGCRVDILKENSFSLSSLHHVGIGRSLPRKRNVSYSAKQTNRHDRKDQALPSTTLFSFELLVFCKLPMKPVTEFFVRVKHYYVANGVLVSTTTLLRK